MNALIQFVKQKEAERGFYCPACRERGLDVSDMDLDNGWHHSLAMRERYGAACCTACTDAHIVTADGVCMPKDAASFSDYLDAYYSSSDAMFDAEEDGREEYDAEQADHRMYSGWR